MVSALATPMLVTGTTVGGTHIRRWVAASQTWGPGTDGPAVTNGDPIRGVTLRRSPVNGHRTLAIYTIHDGTGPGALFVYDWDGSKFVPAFASTDFGTSGGWAPFDLAFDGKTGHGLAVYGGATSQVLRLRTFDGTKWSDESAVFPALVNDSGYQFVELVTRAGADDRALLYTDSDNHFVATRWLGDHFAPAHTLAGDLSNDVQKELDGALRRGTRRRTARSTTTSPRTTRISKPTPRRR